MRHFSFCRKLIFLSVHYFEVNSRLDVLACVHQLDFIDQFVQALLKEGFTQMRFDGFCAL